MCEQLLKKNNGEEEKNEDGESIDGYDHFEDWRKKDGKCALYMHEIYKVDPRWPKEEELCILRLHELKTLRHLHELCSHLSLEDFQSLFDTYPEISSFMKNSFFSFEDIIEGEYVCIMRDH